MENLQGRSEMAINEKLDYLQDLGINIHYSLFALYESVFYHNYFSGDFLKKKSTERVWARCRFFF